MANIVAVDFRSDTLVAVERDDGVFVAIKPICETLGVNWNKQLERIKRDAVLSEGMTMMVIPSAGGTQETTLLRLDLVNGWLFTLDENRVRDEATRQRVLTYKRECHAVLFRHFYGRAAERPAPAEVIEPLPEMGEPDGPKVRLVTEARHTFGTHAAAQLWFRLGLPIVPAMYHDPRQGELLGHHAPGAIGESDAA